MEPYRYYRDGENVIAIDLDNAVADLAVTGNYGAFVAVFNQPDSPVCYSGVSPEYLEENCEEVTEEEARLIHPNLFARLDDDDF